MSRYTVFDPNTELTGRTAFSLIRNINHEDIENILISHHLDHIDPDQWYPLQAVLDVLSDISDNMNASENMVAIGMAAAQLTLEKLPEQYVNATFEGWMTDYCTIIQPSRHRNGYNGVMTFHKESDSHYTITMISPYPDDLMYGLFYVYIRHFKPADQDFVLRYDETVQRHDHGGTETIYHITFSTTSAGGQKQSASRTEAKPAE